jgi:hypothetical protein
MFVSQREIELRLRKNHLFGPISEAYLPASGNRQIAQSLENIAASQAEKYTAPRR